MWVWEIKLSHKLLQNGCQNIISLYFKMNGVFSDASIDRTNKKRKSTYVYYWCVQKSRGHAQ